MRILKTLLLLPLKLLALPVLFLLKVIYVLANLVTTLGSYVVSPLILFVLGCGIWCATQSRWTDAGLLAGIEVLIIGAVFAAVWLTDLLLTLSDGLVRFLHAG